MGMFICKLRKENNMTQMELAQQLHVTDKAVSRWERGIGYPDIQLLPALSESLHVSVAELISCKKSLNYSNGRSHKYYSQFRCIQNGKF